MAVPTRVRIDKWLWAARFFKTRSMANEAVAGGHVEVNGTRAKASKDVVVGDTVELRLRQSVWRLKVTGLAERRGSPAVAASLFEEDPAGRAQRERRAEELRAARPPGADLGARPTKRERRQIERFVRRSQDEIDT